MVSKRMKDWQMRVEWEEDIKFRNIRKGHDLSFNREALSRGTGMTSQIV